MMKTRKVAAPLTLAAVLAASLAAEQAIAACEWKKGEDGHAVITRECTVESRKAWGDAIQKILSVPLIRTGPVSDLRVALAMPNLKITDIRNTWNPISGGRETIAVITNDTSVDVRQDFVVRGTLSITDAYRTGLHQNGIIQRFPDEFVTVNGLDAGDTKQVVLHKAVQMPNSTQDFDMWSSAYVDWDNYASGGEVAETDETDNYHTEHCRLFQADPDEAAPPPIPPQGDC